jgi:hypothetical protein
MYSHACTALSRKLTYIRPYWRLSITYSRLLITKRDLIHRSDIPVCPSQLVSNCVKPQICHFSDIICITTLFKHTVEKIWYTFHILFSKNIVLNRISTKNSFSEYVGTQSSHWHKSVFRFALRFLRWSHFPGHNQNHLHLVMFLLAQTDMAVSH